MTKSVQRLRKLIFVDDCGWDLPIIDGRECDAFDTSDALYGVLLDHNGPRACFRAIPANRPYLAAEVFPQLAVVSPFPRRSDAWEISRFGVDPRANVMDIGRLNYALMIWFARQVRATSLIAIADLRHERLLRAVGIRTRRYGPPQIVGRDIAVVAGEIPIALQSSVRMQTLLTLLDDVEILDASDVFGPACISA